MPALVRRALAALALLVTVAAAPTPSPAPASTERIVLAGGCFWGMEAVFASLRGVVAVQPGYTGGAAATAHYALVSTGATGHAESVEIRYDPRVISLAQLLAVDFTVAHDPTQADGQGPDLGSQYRSAIFTTTSAQQAVALAAIRDLDRSHRYPRPATTRVEPLRAFYPAEAYHRRYAWSHLDQPYIVEEDLPKLALLRERFPQLVAPGSLAATTAGARTASR